MTLRGSKDFSLFLLNGYDLLGTITEIEDKTEGVIINMGPPFGQSDDVHAFTGVRMMELSQKGYYDDGAGSAHETLSTGPGRSRVLSYCYNGTAPGVEFTGYAGALQVDYKIAAKRGDLHRAEANYKGAGPIEQGVVIRPSKVTTASGNTTGAAIDNGASSIAGGAGYLQVKRLDGIGTLTVKLRHSPDNLTFTDLYTFAGNTSAASPTAQRTSASGPIQRYVAADWSFATGTPSASAEFFVGLVRG